MGVSIIEPVVSWRHDNPDRPLRASLVEPCPHRLGRPGGHGPSHRQSALRVRRRLSGPRVVPVRRHGRGHRADDGGRGGAGLDVRRSAGLSRTPRARVPQVPGVRGPRGDAGEHLRRELVRLAEEFDTFILEDDAYGELRFEGEAKPPVYALDRGGRVIRAGTLSKILGAGVRLGWLCAPRAMLPAFQGFNFGGGVSPFMSRVATWYLRDHMEAHVKRLIGVYRAKRDAMLRGLWEVLEGIDVEISRPQGGFFIWIRLPAATDPARLEALAVAAQAQYTSGPAFFPDSGGERFIRLAFSYEPPEKCYEGARLIARAILDARR